MALAPDDHEEIRQLLARYNFAIDLGDIDGWVACFTPDGSFECLGLPDGHPFGGKHIGAAALRAYCEGHFGRGKGRGRHGNFNLLIEGDGDEATMQCYMDAYRVGLRDGATGIYRDTLQRTPGGWRFVTRQVTVDAVE